MRLPLRVTSWSRNALQPLPGTSAIWRNCDDRGILYGIVGLNNKSGWQRSSVFAPRAFPVFMAI